MTGLDRSLEQERSSSLEPCLKIMDKVQILSRTELLKGQFSGASAKFNAVLNASMRCLFAQGGGCDAPLSFDYLVSKEEQALSSDGERDYLVGIVAVPVLSSVAGVERVQNTLPMSIDARQIDHPV